MVTFPRHRAAVLRGHNGPVHCVEFSAGSGSYVLSGCADRIIRLFNPARQRTSNDLSADCLVQTFSAHGYEVLDLAVAGDNSRFASVGGDRQVFLWDVTTGQTLRRWTGHGARVNAVCFGGDGDSVVISGSFDATVKIWDAKSNSSKPIQTLEDARDSVTSVCARGDSAEIVTGSTDGTVKTYDLRMGSMKTDHIGSPVTSVQITADGEAMLVSSLDSKIRLFDRANGKCLKEYQGHQNASYRIRSCLGLGDAVALSGGEKGEIFAWDVLSGELVDTIEQAHGGKVPSAVSWNGRKKEWASAGGDGTVVVWNLPPS